jgi:hypothetical protein
MKTLDEIFQATADYFLVEKKLLLKHTRYRHISVPRQMAVYISKVLFNHTQGTIAAYCNHDRTTMVYSCAQIQGFLHVNDFLFVDALKKISEDLGYVKPVGTLSEMYILQKKYDKLATAHEKLKNKLLQLV